MDEDSEGSDRWLFINDWPMRRYLLLSFHSIVFLILFAGARWLAPDAPFGNLGYLLVPLIVFLPGAGIMRIFRLHGAGMARSAMYSLALSLVLIMFIGFFLNLLHYAGLVESPLAFWPMVLSYIAVQIVITFGARIRDNEYRPPASRPLRDPMVLMSVALAMLAPFAVLMGTHLTGFSEDRTLMRIIVTCLCLLPLAAISRRIKNYDLLILSASISFLFQRVLMTNYMMGYDIFTEYTAAKITISNGWWNVFEYGGMQGAGANTALSVVTLAPMLHHLTGIGLIDLFRIVYPFLFSFVALGVYRAVRSQLGNWAGITGAFILISYQAYYNLLSQMVKQETAEIFLVILLLVITETAFTKRSHRWLAAVCVLGVIVSHYGLGYITMGFVGGMFLLNSISSIYSGLLKGKGALGRVRSALGEWMRGQSRTEIFSLYLLAFYAIVFFAWYATTGSGVMLSFVKVTSEYIPVDQPSSGLTLAQFDALEYILINYGSAFHNIEKYLVLTAQILCVVGLVYVFLNRKGLFKNVERNFINMAILALMILLACFIIPGFSSLLYFARFFHLTFIFLAGFMLLGIAGVVHATSSLLGRKDAHKEITRWVAVAGMLFVIAFALFNTSVMFVLSDDYSNSFTVDESNSWAIYSDTDVIGAKWVGLEEHRGSHIINADLHRFTIFIGDSVPSDKLRYQWTSGNTDTLVYLSTWNNQYRYVYAMNTVGTTQTYTPLSDVLDQFDGNYNIVYNGGGSTSVIYVPPSKPVTNPPGPVFVEYETVPLYYLGTAAILLIGLGASSLALRAFRVEGKQ